MSNSQIAYQIALLDLRKISGIHTRQFLNSVLRDIATRGGLHPNIKKKTETILHHYNDPKYQWQPEARL